MTLTFPKSLIVIHKTLDSFVEYRKLWVPGSNNATIASRIKSYVELLQQLLVSTGGGLNLQKCKWMILNEQQDEISTIHITRPLHEAQAIYQAVQTYECAPTFGNLHILSRLCGLSTPTHLNNAEPIDKYRSINSQAPLKKVPQD